MCYSSFPEPVLFQSLCKLQPCLWREWKWKSTLSVSSSLMASPSWRMWWTIVSAAEKSQNSTPFSGFLASHSIPTLFPHLRDEVVCADKRPFCSCPWDKTNGWTEKTKALSGVILVAISCFWHGCGCTAPQTAGNVVVLTKVLSRMRNMRIITIFPHRWAYGKASWNKTSLDKKGWKQRRNTCHLQMQEIRFMNMWQHQS